MKKKLMPYLIMLFIFYAIQKFLKKYFAINLAPTSQEGVWILLSVLVLQW